MSAEPKEWITLTAEEEGERLDKILANRFSDIQSRTYFQTLIEEGNVLLNGKPTKKRIKGSAGDELEIHFVLTPEIDLKPENIPLDILYEDDAILVINKPAGMVVHPAPGNWSGTFVNALLYHCQGIGDGSLRPGIVHRLDKGTTGVLIAAKTPQAQQRLVESFSGRKVGKQYLAICIGNPGHGTIDAPIGRHPVDRKRMAIRHEGGRQAISRCHTEACDGKLSVVTVELITGRTHQVRVHLKHKGAPILGDDVYGNRQLNEKYEAKRPLLHAQELRLDHPITGKALIFTAPIPEDIQHFIKRIS